ncbi:hypothetical protein [Shewanella loihica]|uniref:hypothetical protein n=1 Tax=Shewanella loihica TaxID=359303 RepID=UPI00005D7994|nr:hypothetical protein [Shewanella loihica]
MEIAEEINNILTEWNPIEVPKDIARVEYLSYVERIFELIADKEKLVILLERIVSQEMGLNYNPQNSEHKTELVNIAAQICALVK